MSLNSVNTNITAYTAVESLNLTNSALAATQKKISTGYRVADATDDGAAFAIAERVRSDVGALTEVNAQLGNTKGLLNVTANALTKAVDTISLIKAKVVDLSNGATSADQATQDKATIGKLVTQLQKDLSGATYNGKSLISVTGSAATRIAGVTDETGATFGITSFDGSAIAASIAALTQAAGGTALAALSTTTGSVGVLANVLSTLTTAQNNYGGDSNFVDNQTTYNSNKIDALRSGIGSLIDADLTKESANLQSLQIRQQLGTQALSIANQAPQSLLSLFK